MENNKDIKTTVFNGNSERISQPPFACPRLTLETPEQSVKSIQS